MANIKVPVKGETKRVIQPQYYRNEFTSGWYNVGFPVSRAEADILYKRDKEAYDNGRKRMCLLVPIKIETNVTMEVE